MSAALSARSGLEVLSGMAKASSVGAKTVMPSASLSVSTRPAAVTAVTRVVSSGLLLAAVATGSVDHAVEGAVAVGGDGGAAVTEAGRRHGRLGLGRALARRASTAGVSSDASRRVSSSATGGEAEGEREGGEPSGAGAEGGVHGEPFVAIGVVGRVATYRRCSVLGGRMGAIGKKLNHFCPCAGTAEGGVWRRTRRLRPAPHTARAPAPQATLTEIVWMPLEPSGNGFAGRRSACRRPSITRRRWVLAGVGVPRVEPLAPVVVVDVGPSSASCQGPPSMRTSTFVDARVLGPGDAADDDLAGRAVGERLGGVDAARDLDRGVGRPVALGPVGLLVVVGRQRDPGDPLGGADEAVEAGHDHPGREAVLAGQRLAVHADREHRVAAVGGQVERRADGHAVDVGGEDLVGLSSRRRPGRGGRSAVRRASGRRRRTGRRPRWRRRSG